MHFSDSDLLDFSLSQKENLPPILVITKPRHSTPLKTITIEEWFIGTFIREKILHNTKVVEYMMLFPGPYPIEPKTRYYGSPINPNTYLEDTELCFHFNRKTHKIELSHLCKGNRTLALPPMITKSFSQKARSNIEATIMASWVFDETITVDLMPYIGSHIDTYTPLRGFGKTEELDIIAPIADGAFLKKVRHLGPFYHAITKKYPIEENITLSVNYDACTTNALLFKVPEPYGESYLMTDEGQQWIEYFERMIHRIDLKQSRRDYITVSIPLPYDVTLDDMFTLNNKSYKVIEYEIKKGSTKIIGAALAHQNPCIQSKLERNITPQEHSIIVQVKNDATTQEVELQAGNPIPKTTIECIVLKEE